MKNVIFFSGNHLRHKFIADKLISKNYNLIWITMPRDKDIIYKGKLNNYDADFFRPADWQDEEEESETE